MIININLSACNISFTDANVLILGSIIKHIVVIHTLVRGVQSNIDIFNVLILGSIINHTVVIHSLARGVIVQHTHL